MTRIIRIPSCNVCPNRATRGAGRDEPVSHVPYCRIDPEHKTRDIPYFLFYDSGQTKIARQEPGVMPDWCPLEEIS